MKEEIQKEHKLIAVYGRVSTSKQEDEGTIETQLADARHFAKEKGYTIVQQYIDDGWPGDNLERPGLDQLRMDAGKKSWEAVLAYDPDRLGRSYTHQEVVMDELKERGIETLFVTVGPIANDDDQLMYEIRGAFAKYERVKIRERFRIGKKRKVEEGHVLTTEAPYGYEYIRNDKEKKKHGYYEINEAEARVVRMMFSWVADDGLTLRKVVTKLHQLGIAPRKSKRGVWSTSTLSSLFRNKAYIGEAHYGSTYSVIPENPINKEKFRRVKKSSRRMKPENEWIATKIPVPVIIDRKLFDKARTQLDDNFALCQRNTRNEYLLSGRIVCSCGTKRCGEGPQKGKHLYYRCSNRVYSYPLPRTCLEGGINARIADDLVWKEISGFMTSPDLMLTQLARWTDARLDKTDSSVVDIEVIKNKIAKLKVNIGKYNKAYEADVLTMEELRECLKPIREEMAGLESQIREIKSEKDKLQVASAPSREEIEVFAQQAAKTLKDLSFESKRGIIRSTVEKIISTQKQLEVVGRIILKENYVEYKTECGYRRTSKCR
jgi:site-specific DNA recombinase